MAERRMFTKKITNSDAFIDMPLSTQALYFHLNMESDDDGFNSSPKKVQRMIGASDDDLKLLFAKNFVIPFESGVVVIKHWKLHNYIQNDRYKETVYLEEKSLLNVKKNKSYTLMDTKCIQDGYNTDTQVRLGKDSIGKDNIIEEKPKKEKKQYADFVKMTEEEYNKLIDRFGEKFTIACINVLDNYKGSKGKEYQDDYRAILSWVVKRVKEDGLKPEPLRKEEYVEFDTDNLSPEEYAKLIKGDRNV